MKKENGFTILEMVMIITILSVLIGISFPLYQGYINNYKQKKCDIECNALKEAFYYLNTAFYDPWIKGGYYPIDVYNSNIGVDNFTIGVFNGLFQRMLTNQNVIDKQDYSIKLNYNKAPLTSEEDNLGVFEVTLNSGTYILLNFRIYDGGEYKLDQAYFETIEYHHYNGCITKVDIMS